MTDTDVTFLSCYNTVGHTREKHEQPRRQLTGFCEDCWQHTHLRHGREDVADMSFLFNAGVFNKSTRIDPSARLKGNYAAQAQAQRQGH
jgi:hypothetical protein